jgi:hypothetical protein
MLEGVFWNKKLWGDLESYALVLNVVSLERKIYSHCFEGKELNLAK